MKKLIYTSPATHFNEATPLGNGHMGAMVFGSPCQETIQLNADTFWSGRPLKDSYDATSKLPEVRELIDGGKIAEAEDFLNSQMLGHFTQSYIPVGNLKLVVSDHYQACDYKRTLDLEKGMLSIDYAVGQRTYKRELFCSYKHKALIIRLTSSSEKSITCGITMDSPFKSMVKNIGDRPTLITQAPSHMDPVYDLTDHPIQYSEEDNLYACTSITPVTDGRISYDDELLTIKNATEVLFIVTCETNFVNYNTLPYSIEELLENNDKLHNSLKKLDYTDLLEEHLSDYTSLYGNTGVKLCDEEDIHVLPLLQQAREGNVPLALIESLFSFGRYLAISSSRDGSQATNLQGVWNDLIQAPWCSNYTININTQMNYWPMDTTNLSPCVNPLIDFIKDLSKQGVESAKALGCSGWTAHHNTDLWRQCIPVGGHGQYAFWPFGGPWLATHLVEHYRFTQDKDYLEDIYPILKSSYDFCTSWIYKEGDYYITNPATSPENRYMGNDQKSHFLSKATTMDLSIIWQIIKDYKEASLALGIEHDESADHYQETLYPYLVGKDGTLQEWCEDFAQNDLGHRHLSHLLGVYPGTRLLEADNDELLEAVLKSLQKRKDGGSGHTSWSCAWFILLYARLHKGNNSEEFVHKFFTNSLLDNLFSSHPPFQIDGNFGYTAGIAEMLLQSHGEVIEVLPALPATWQKGSFTDLKARGNLLISAQWEDGKVKHLTVKSKQEGSYTIKINGELHTLACKNGETTLSF